MVVVGTPRQGSRLLGTPVGHSPLSTCHFPEACQSVSLGAPTLGTKSSLSFPMSLLAALKVAPLSFLLLLKLKWPRWLASVAFYVATGMHLPYYRTCSVSSSFFLLMASQKRPTHLDSLINIFYTAYTSGRGKGAIHFWK